MVEEVFCNLEYIEVEKKCMNKLHIHTDNGQKYLHASNFPYIFHIKLQFSEAYPEVNSHPISIIFISIKT